MKPNWFPFYFSHLKEVAVMSSMNPFSSGLNLNLSFSLDGAVSVVFLILAIVGAVCLLAFFLPKSKKDSYSGFTAKLYDFLNFNTYWLPFIVKATYIFLTIMTVLSGLYMMFTYSFVAGLLTAVLSPIFLRLLYEVFFLLYSIRENLKDSKDTLREIAQNTKKED